MPSTVLLMGLLLVYAISSGKLMVLLNILKVALRSDIFQAKAFEEKPKGKEVLDGEYSRGSKVS